MTPFCKLKIFFGRTAAIDNYIFRLHCRVTFAILIALAVLVALKPLFFRPLICSSHDDFSIAHLEAICWSHGTYTAVEDWQKKAGVEVPYPGVGKYYPGEVTIYYAYYQWVYLILFLQGIAFYLPGHFWKRMEGGKIRSLIAGLDSPLLPEDKATRKRNLIVEYLAVNVNNHKLYFLMHVFAEILNFVNVVGQLFVMNDFLGGEFLSSVAKFTEITEWGQQSRNDSLVKIFPRVAKCRVHRYGSSGDTQRYDALCVLTSSSFNEKIFIFLYLWFIVLAVLSAMAILWRIASTFYPRSCLKINRARARVLNHRCMEDILSKFKIGDWFILDLLSKNLDFLTFRDVIHDLGSRLSTKEVPESDIFLKEMVKVDHI